MLLEVIIAIPTHGSIISHSYVRRSNVTTFDVKTLDLALGLGKKGQSHHLLVTITSECEWPAREIIHDEIYKHYGSP